MRCRVWRWIGMHKDHCLAALKFFEDRLQSSVSEVYAPGVREENKTIESEDVDCVRELFQRGIDIRQWDASETCKPVRSCMNEFGREFVAPPCQRPSLLAISKVDSRRAHGHHGNVDPGVVHERDHRLFGPLKRRQPSDGSMRIICLPPEEVRQYVMMGVDGQRCIWIAGHAVPCCQPRISLAARPAIMWVDAFVPGPVMICGITEASATRKPKMPCTRSSGSTTASLSTPILQVPTACPKLAEASLASSRISSALALGPGISSLSRKLSKACWLPSSRAISMARTTAAKS